MIISYCPACGYEEWGTEPIIKKCCGCYVLHEEREGEE
ncbi:hypothetical protein PK36_gp34 [Geobacillus phage vB_GthS_PK3.6]|nr:hypothetical protein PK36_gp34 [Geobacillus phage vB_GthS_PK3.6]